MLDFSPSSLNYKRQHCRALAAARPWQPIAAPPPSGAEGEAKQLAILVWDKCRQSATNQENGKSCAALDGRTVLSIPTIFFRGHSHTRLAFSLDLLQFRKQLWRLEYHSFLPHTRRTELLYQISFYGSNVRAYRSVKLIFMKKNQSSMNVENLV